MRTELKYHFFNFILANKYFESSNFSYRAFPRITTDETKYKLKENLIGGGKPHLFLKSGVKEENEEGNNVNQN